jgi:hypothetical protein
MKTSQDVITEKAYDLYKQFDLPQRMNEETYLKKHDWCCLKTETFGNPVEYRHYHYNEFVDKSVNDPEFKKFFNKLFEKSKEEYYEEITERLRETLC